jgi:Domain of unknown function (DUF4260)
MIRQPIAVWKNLIPVTPSEIKDFNALGDTNCIRHFEDCLRKERDMTSMNAAPSGATRTPSAKPGLAIPLQAEGAAVGLLSCYFYAQLGGGWGLFAVLILAPDIFMLGYLAGRRIGAILYNTGHSYLAPLALAVSGQGAGAEAAILVALIWGAHIGFDRAMGYGLKYKGHFKDTHLGRV